MKIKLLGLLLGALGFTAMLSSCNAPEYGSPYVDFTLKGKVTDREQNPIKGIKVSYKVTEYRGYKGLSGLSDDKGNYLLNDPRMWEPGSDGAIFADVTAEDIDGPENGSFETQTKTFNLSGVDFTGGNGNWFVGSGERVVDFTLEPVGENGEKP